MCGQFRALLQQQANVSAALVIGSVARGEATANSDLDLSVLTEETFEPDTLVAACRAHLGSWADRVSYLPYKSRILIWNVPSGIRVEITIARHRTDLVRNWLGSEIPESRKEAAILFDETGTLLPFLLQQETEDRRLEVLHNSLPELVGIFVYYFEHCSSAHRRSDGFHFCFFYNCALPYVVRIWHLLGEDTRFNFLPKYFLPSLSSNEERESWYELNGRMFLPDANAKKRALLNKLYEALERHRWDKLEEARTFLEAVFERDFFWNFRDMAKNVPGIAKGQIYRSATLSLFQDESRFAELLDRHSISTLIDLRADREVQELPYSAAAQKRIGYVHAPFDPWNQPQWFKDSHHYGTKDEIAYCFFVLGCKPQIKKAFQAVLNQRDGAVVIHCFAGKDRTGILIAMLHLLLGVADSALLHDYLASEVDVKESRLRIVLNLIDKAGGIESYLQSCGLAAEELQALKNKLSYG